MARTRESLENSIMRRIIQSIELYKKLYKTIDDETIRLLKELDTSFDETERIRKKIGMTKECEDCAREGRSCCGSGMENHYNMDVILINLLMGVDLYQQRLQKDSCYFLGDNGCILKAREVICVNFLCDRIYSRIPWNNIILFQEVSGRGLEKLFYLEERIRRYLARTEQDPQNRDRISQIFPPP